LQVTRRIALYPAQLTSMGPSGGPNENVWFHVGSVRSGSSFREMIGKFAPLLRRQLQPA
jgi:hypothetical protein